MTAHSPAQQAKHDRPSVRLCGGGLLAVAAHVRIESVGSQAGQDETLAPSIAMEASTKNATDYRSLNGLVALPGTPLKGAGLHCCLSASQRPPYCGLMCTVGHLQAPELCSVVRRYTSDQCHVAHQCVSCAMRLRDAGSTGFLSVQFLPFGRFPEIFLAPCHDSDVVFSTAQGAGGHQTLMVRCQCISTCSPACYG